MSFKKFSQKWRAHVGDFSSCRICTLSPQNSPREEAYVFATPICFFPPLSQPRTASLFLVPSFLTLLSFCRTLAVGTLRCGGGGGFGGGGGGVLGGGLFGGGVLWVCCGGGGGGGGIVQS